jgi:hypothetical protein
VQQDIFDSGGIGTTAIVFDTHNYVKRLKAVGVSEEHAEEQAEVHAEALATLVNEQLVTKQYLDLRLAELKNDLIKWVVGICAAQAAIIVTLLKLVLK